jgi:hypothetical protein
VPVRRSTPRIGLGVLQIVCEHGAIALTANGRLRSRGGNPGKVAESRRQRNSHNEAIACNDTLISDVTAVMMQQDQARSAGFGFKEVGWLVVGRGPRGVEGTAGIFDAK